MDALSSCLGNDTNWTRDWSQRCPTIVAPPDVETTTLRTRVNQIVDRLNFDGETINDVNSPAREVYTGLMGICQATPSACSQALPQICDHLQTEDLDDEITAKLCGCYLPDGAYHLHETKFNLGRECTPLCRAAGTIPYVPPGTGEPLKCQSHICLLDGTETTCSHCAPNCSCWITPSGQEAPQICLSSLNVTEEGQPVVEASSNGSCSKKWTLGFWIVIGIIILTIIIALVVYLVKRRKEAKRELTHAVVEHKSTQPAPRKDVPVRPTVRVPEQAQPEILRREPVPPPGSEPRALSYEMFPPKSSRQTMPPRETRVRPRQVPAREPGSPIGSGYLSSIRRLEEAV